MDKQKLLIRPVCEHDLIPLCDIAHKVGAALPSLPSDKASLAKKIQLSLDSFAQKNEHSSRLFLFVLEDVLQHKLIATSAIEAEAGYLSPFYSYCVETLIQNYTFHEHQAENSIKIHREQENKVLYLSNHYQEASLLCTLWVDPKHRSLGQGSFMSRMRYLFMAEFPDFFSDSIIAEMRGVFDENNQFPFWKGLGQLFYNMDIQQAEILLAHEGSQFISKLNPMLPIYVALLPIEAQKAIAEVNTNTKPALHLLEKEGFIYRNHIDVFDGGPIVEARKKDIRTIKTSQTAILVGFKTFNTSPDASTSLYMICNTKLNFRVTLGLVEWHQENEVYLEEDLAQLLELSVGDKIRLNLFR